MQKVFKALLFLLVSPVLIVFLVSAVILRTVLGKAKSKEFFLHMSKELTKL